MQTNNKNIRTLVFILISLGIASCQSESSKVKDEVPSVLALDPSKEASEKIATAKNLLEKAAKAGFEWSTTAPLILKAEEALHAGNNEQALELVEKAILEANGSLAQRKYAEEHWQDHAIN